MANDSATIMYVGLGVAAVVCCSAVSSSAGAGLYYVTRDASGKAKKTPTPTPEPTPAPTPTPTPAGYRPFVHVLQENGTNFCVAVDAGGKLAMDTCDRSLPRHQWSVKYADAGGDSVTLRTLSVADASGAAACISGDPNVAGAFGLAACKGGGGLERSWAREGSEANVFRVRGLVPKRGGAEPVNQCVTAQRGKTPALALTTCGAPQESQKFKFVPL